jgi:hypothetical protein
MCSRNKTQGEGNGRKYNKNGKRIGKGNRKDMEEGRKRNRKKYTENVQKSRKENRKEIERKEYRRNPCPRYLKHGPGRSYNEHGNKTMDWNFMSDKRDEVMEELPCDSGSSGIPAEGPRAHAA